MQGGGQGAGGDILDLSRPARYVITLLCIFSLCFPAIKVYRAAARHVIASILLKNFDVPSKTKKPFVVLPT